MPTEDPAKRIHMTIDPITARIIIAQEPTFKSYLTRDGRLLVALDKALYGCIESARLWNDEISGMLSSFGFTANPKNKCVFNMVVRGSQVILVVYADDLMITSLDKEAVLDIETKLRKAYGQFRITTGKELTYLGCTWDFRSRGVVRIGQSGMIQDLVTSRERNLSERTDSSRGVHTHLLPLTSMSICMSAPPPPQGYCGMRPVKV